jgi:nicotinamide-nucleotide amidase
MPGVPYEMKAIINDYVIPELTDRFNPQVIIHKTVLTQGFPESMLAKKIESWEEALPSNIKLAYLPNPGVVRLRLSATGKDRSLVEAQIQEEIEALKTIIPQAIFGFDKDTLQEIVGYSLKEKKLNVSTAESCTGGYIAHLITSISGSSEYFKGSVVAYSNEIKKSVLGVKHQTLIDFGAVSEEVVSEMALGVKNKLETDYAIATTGIAGPGGGTKEKPVGTTWIAIATPSQIITRKFQMSNHRERNIVRTSMTALKMLRIELLSLG